jgi:hypothetical protein
MADIIVVEWQNRLRLDAANAMSSDKPALVSIDESEFRCSICPDFKIEIFPNNSVKSPAEWQHFLQREFAEHIQRRHGVTAAEPEKRR